MHTTRFLIAIGSLLALSAPAMGDEISTTPPLVRPPTATPTAAAPATAPSAATRPTTAPASQPATQPVSSLGEGTRVTLSLKNASAKDAFAALEKASGIKVTTQPEILERAAATITYEVDQGSWLAAMYEICQQAGLFPQQIQPSGWMISNGGDRRMNGRRSIRGPTMIVCHSVGADTEIQYGLSKANETRVSLGCILVAEASVSIVSVDGNVVLEEVLDGDGKPVAVTIPETRFQRSFGAYSGRRDFQAQFNLAGPPPAKFSRVRGKIHLNLLDKTLELKVENLLAAEGKTFDVDGTSFTVSRVSLENGSYLVDVSTPSLGALPGTSFHQAPFMPRLEGRQPHEVRFQQMQVRDNNLVLTLVVRPQLKQEESDDPPKVELVWPLPGTFKRVELPFEFKDLTVPQ